VKPLIYGYMRMIEGVLDGDVRQMELVLRDYAEREGYCFATFFYEEDDGTMSAFTELIHELNRAEARHVIVPSGDHIARSPQLRSSRIRMLQHNAGAHVHVLSDIVKENKVEPCDRV
jgi:hypothetical protein